MAVYCKGCGERMTDAPEHIEHEGACIKKKLWQAIEAYAVATRKHQGRVEAVAAARAEVDRLIGAGRFGYGYG